MKIWSKATIVAIAILGAALMGCGSDSKSSSSSTTDTGAVATTDNGTPATGDTTTPPTEDTTTPPTEDTTTPPTEDTTVEPPPLPTNACTNAADDALFTDPAADVSGKTGNCGVGCIGQKDAIGCAQPCIIKDTGVTSDCALCLAHQVNCAIANCIGECAADPGGKPCCQCRLDKKCVENFTTCSGRAAETCE